MVTSRSNRPNFARALWVRFWRDQRASYTLEFALCAFPFFFLIFAVVESSYVYYFTDALQLAVSQASRAIETGIAQSNFGSTNPQTRAGSGPEFATNYICHNTGGGGGVGSDTGFPHYLSCANLVVDVRSAASFTAGDTVPPETNPNASPYGQPVLYCLGTPREIVIIRVAYPLPAILPLSLFTHWGVAKDGKGNTIHVVNATQSIYIEPYVNSGAYVDPAGCPPGTVTG